MNAVVIGPLMISPERFSVILATIALVLVASIMARTVNQRFSGWSSWSVIAFAAGARLGHVALNYASFSADPLRSFAVWEGGFFWPTGALAAIVLSIVYLRQPRLVAWSALPMATGGLVAILTFFLVAEQNLAPLPASAFMSTDGRTIVPASLKGVPLVINIWATWCPPCRRELPMMAEVARESAGTTFLFINQGENNDAIVTFLAKQGISLETTLLDPAGETSHHYHILGLPTTLFVDVDGNVKSTNVGEISRENLQAGVNELR